MIKKLSEAEYNSMVNELMTLKEASDYLNIKSATLNSYIAKGKRSIVAYYSPSSKILVSKFSVYSLKELQIYIRDFSKVKDLAEKFNNSSNFWNKAIRKEKPKGLFSRLSNRTMYIPNDFADSYYAGRIVPKDTLNTSEIAELLYITERNVNSLRNRGLLGETYSGLDENKNSVSVNKMKDILNFKKMREDEETFINEEDYVNVEEIIELFPYEVSIGTVMKLINTGTFNNVYKKKFSVKGENKKNYVKREEVLKYIDKRVNLYRHSKTTDPLKIFEDTIKNIKVSEGIKETMDLFVSYSRKKIKSSNSNQNQLERLARSLGIHYLNINKVLDKDIHLLTDEEIRMVLEGKELNNFGKNLFVKFLKYVKKNKVSKFNETYNYAYQHPNNDQKDANKEVVYSWEDVLRLYQYCKDINTHIKYALEDREYAITWLYISTHLVNAWRHSDIVKLPSIDLKGLDINSLEYFKQNQLTIEQITAILTQVDKSKLLHLIISKTRLRRSFYTNASFRPALATAYAIAVLHKINDNDTQVLNFNTKHNTVYERFYNKFFWNLNFPKFSSLKMNRSLMQHLYYSIKDKEGESFTSYEVASMFRGHRMNLLSKEKRYSEVTKAYIGHQYMDLPLDNIAVELFERGEFGYLYYMIIEGINKDHKNDQLSLDTETIKKFRQRYSPAETEDLAKFIQARDSQRNTIAYLAIQENIDDLNEFIRKIYLGEKPSKNNDINCSMSPKCHYPNRSSCIGCEYSIPRGTASLIQSLRDELDEKIYSLSNTNSLANALRDYSVITALLDVLNQVNKQFGKQYVEMFLSIEELKKDLTIASSKFNELKSLN